MSPFEEHYATFKRSPSYNQWVGAHRIGLLAYFMYWDNQRQRDEKRQERWAQLKQALLSVPSFAGFPPSVLHLLRLSLSIPSKALGEAPRTLEERWGAVHNALATLCGENEKQARRSTSGGGRTTPGDTRDQNDKVRRSPLGIAQVLAHNIISGAGSPERIMRLGLALSPGGWSRRNWVQREDDEALMAAVGNRLEALRSPATSVFEKMAAICALSDSLGDLPYWSQVHNALCHQVLSWPLLVLTSRDEVDGTVNIDGGVSLPVAIDIQFDGQSQCNVPPPQGQEDQAFTAWKRHLQKAMDTAKELWDATHSNYGRQFRSEVKRATVTFSFDIACDILQSLPVRDGSAEAYFAQVILAKLLGKTGFISSAASGEVIRVAKLKALPSNMLPFPKDLVESNNELIWFATPSTAEDSGRLVWKGPWTGLEAETYRWRLWDLSTDAAYRAAIDSLFGGRHGAGKHVPRDRPGLKLRTIDGLWEKLSWAFGSQFFERVVLPRAVEQKVNRLYKEKKLREPTAEVVYQPTPAHMADAMQVGGWRRHRYVRCPDLLWGIHAEYDQQRPGLLPAQSHPEVEELVDRLRDNRRAVLELPYSPQVVVSALYHINETLPDTFAPEPPRFSWAFIRAIPEEMDARFWHVVFSRLIGAPDEVFAQFLYSPTPAQAARRLAAALNRFVPPSRCHPGYRAPEILVIVGTGQFRESLVRTDNVESRPLAVPLVLQQLAAVGLAPAPRLQRVLGQTRVLCLPDDQELRVEENPSLEGLSEFELRLLRALGTFRWGFTQQMADLMLHKLAEEDELLTLQGDALRKKLRDEFVEERRLLRYGPGVYYIPSSVRQRLGSLDQPLEAARQHFAAGVALAPYVSVAPVPALAFDLAFLPENIHEAGYHFKAAFSLAQGADQLLASQAKNALQHLFRFVELPHWHAQGELLKDKTATKDAWDLGLELLDGYRQAAAPVHPAPLVNTARAGMLYLRTLRGEHQQAEAEEVHSRVEDLFHVARGACERPEWRASREVNLLRVLSTWSTFLMKEQPDRRQDIERLNEEARSHLAVGGSGATVWGEWFELGGDRQQQHALAAAIYSMGVRFVPTWHQLWIKGLGAELLGGVEGPPILEQLTRKTPEEVCHILKKAASGLKEVREGRAPLPVRERWCRGVEWLDECWKDHPQVRAFLGEYRFLVQPGRRTDRR